MHVLLDSAAVSSAQEAIAAFSTLPTAETTPTTADGANSADNVNESSASTTPATALQLPAYLPGICIDPGANGANRCWQPSQQQRE